MRKSLADEEDTDKNHNVALDRDIIKKSLEPYGSKDLITNQLHYRLCYTSMHGYR